MFCGTSNALRLRWCSNMSRMLRRVSFFRRVLMYQKANPDLPRKPDLKTCNGDDSDDGAALVNHSHTEAKSLRGRSGSGLTTQSPTRDLHFHHVPSPSYSPVAGLSGNLPPASASTSNSNSYNETNEASRSGGGGEDVLLQWGHNKRSRRSRTEGRSPVVVSAAGGIDESSARPRQGGKIPRRSAVAASEKISASTAAGEMPPPSGSYSRSGGGGGLRPSAPLRDATSSLVNNGRTAEERSTVMTRSEKRPPASSSDKSREKPFAGGGGGIAVQGSTHPESKQQQQQEAAVHEPGDGWAAAAGGGEKLRSDRFQWPRIYVSLSRKEKEDDFLAMKGTKLPQRPKKRAKNVDKTLQYCFPGMWLSDLIKGRYEVREKKCVKKKRRGLKGMENMDSDSA